MAWHKKGTAALVLQASKVVRVFVSNLLPVVTGEDGYILVSQSSSDTVHDRVLSLTGSVCEELKPEIFFPLQVKVGVDNRDTLTVLAVTGYAALFDRECSTFWIFRRTTHP
tara:strand:+ start:314 stop:646 length:333 start_codon:yes stop_codon:yes gene_type:complete